MSEAAHPILRAFRGVIAVVAAALVAWSFYWVATRPLRTQKLAAGQVQLTIIHWGEKVEDRIVADLVADFERQPENRDIRIQRVNLGQAAAVNTKLQTMFAAGDAPDVFYLGYEKVADFASKDLLADIEQFISADKAAGRPTIDLNDFYPAVVKCFRYDADRQRTGSGKLIGLPKDFTTVGFYYNKDLFRKAGVPEPPKDDWTWDQFFAAAKKIGEQPGCYGADFVTWEAMVRLWLWTHGCDFGADGWDEYTFTDPKVVAALEKLQGWFHREGRTLVSAKTQLETGQEPFLAGNVGMAGPFGRWKAPIYRQIDSFDWDLAPLPHAAGCPPRNGVFTAAWAISARTKHAEAAWRFVRYMGSTRGQARQCEAGLAIPPSRSVAHSNAFLNRAERPANVKSMLDAAEYAEPIDWPADPKPQHQLRVRLEDVFKLNRPVAPAMARVDREWRDNREKAEAEARYVRVNWPVLTWAILLPIGGLAVALLGVWWLRRPRGMTFREELAGSAMISPWAIGFLSFTAFPIVLSLILAFTKWNGLTTLDFAQYLGLDNFRSLLTDDGTFLKALRITAWYALLAVPSSQIVALLAAMLMNYDWKSIGVFRAVWYLPSVLAGVGMAVMWKWVFHHEHGMLRALLDPILPFGWHTPAVFEKDADVWGVPSFAIVNLWSIGGTMMVYLAGLKGVPKELYEAAAIDGALSWRRFRHVTLPMLSPVIFFNVIIAIIASFQVFTQAYIMTAGGPGDMTRFYVVYLYNQAFDFHDMGYASAMAWMLLLIVLTLTGLAMWGSKRFVYYESLK